MTIGIYADPLMVFTSAMPQRGVIKKLIGSRKEDTFIFFVHRKTFQHPVIVSFFEQLNNNSNWSVSILPIPYKLTKILQLIGFEFPLLNNKADIYFSPDFETFGKTKHPVINYLPDMSVYDDPMHTSLSRFGNFFRKSGIRRMAISSDVIIVISQFTADRFAFHFPFSKNKIKLIHNGIDDEWFKYPEEEHVPVKKYWIWMGGSYNSRKNLDRLLTAYQRLVFNHSEGNIPNLIFAGLNEESISKLTPIIFDLNLLPYVTLKPKISLYELIQIVDNSIGLLFPSIYEGFGLPVIEALARGKSVLTSNTSSLVEISGGNAILCDPYNTDSIYTSMLEMLSINENDHKLINERKEWASNFRYSVAEEKIYAVFQLFNDKIMLS